MANKKISDLDVQATLEDLAKFEVETVAGASGHVTLTTLVAEISGALTVPSEATAGEIQAGAVAGDYVSPDKMFDAAVPVALTDGATVTPNFANGFNFTWTIGGNRTLANPTNPKPGQTGCIEITQDGTGTRLISAFGSDYRFVDGTEIVLSTAAGSVDLLFYYVTAGSKIFVSAQKAIAA